MGMTKASKTQRARILDAHERRGAVSIGSQRTLYAMVSRRWVKQQGGILGGYYPTPAGLSAAGIDLDAIHADAYREALARIEAAQWTPDKSGGELVEHKATGRLGVTMRNEHDVDRAVPYVWVRWTDTRTTSQVSARDLRAAQEGH